MRVKEVIIGSIIGVILIVAAGQAAMVTARTIHTKPLVCPSTKWASNYLIERFYGGVYERSTFVCYEMPVSSGRVLAVTTRLYFGFVETREDVSDYYQKLLRKN